MCLAIPGKVIEIFDEGGLKMGKIDYSGTINKACLAYVPEVEVGQYVIVHAGFAISVMDEDEAEEVFQTFDEMTEALKKEGYRVENEPLSKKKKDEKKKSS
ncbi:HypC/HybG/HupF family hydrogenase formation chaperone [Caldithrix abyssi]